MNLHDAFQRYKVCIVRITIELPNGDLTSGTGFHIGNGYLVTARHVVEGYTIRGVVAEHVGEDVRVQEILYADDPRVDLALLKTDFSLEHYMTMVSFHPEPLWEKTDITKIGGHLDDWVSDTSILSKALLMGYPVIPRSNSPVIVAVEAEVNAVIDRYDSPHPYFVISSVQRGGFSGGPVISEWDFSLGVLVHTLYEGDKGSELGFAAVISIEPLLDLVYQTKIECGENSRFVKWLFESGAPDEYPE